LRKGCSGERSTSYSLAGKDLPVLGGAESQMWKTV
jgi:hypothetical protein